MYEFAYLVKISFYYFVIINIIIISEVLVLTDKISFEELCK